MLDAFEILTTSGVVLWSKSYVPLNTSVINSFIKDVFIEEKTLGASHGDDMSAAQNPSFKKDQYTLKWTRVKELSLIFVAVYQSLLHLSWVDKLLDNIRVIFIDLYRDQLKKPHTSVIECHFDNYFEQQVNELERSGDHNALRTPLFDVTKLTPPSSSDNSKDKLPLLPGLHSESQQTFHSNEPSTDVTPIPTPDNSRPATPLLNPSLSPKPKNKNGVSRRARKAASSANVSSGDEELHRKVKITKPKAKTLRKWDAGGIVDELDGENLDYSVTPPTDKMELPSNGGLVSHSIDAIDPESFGKRTGKGQFVLKDFDNEVHSILEDANHRKLNDATEAGTFVGSSFSAITGLFRNVVGGKYLTKADLEKPMKGMEEHLLKKNVAREAAVRLCAGVERDLIGVKTGSFSSVESTIRTAMESSLRKILTPTTSLDLLRSIAAVTAPTSPLTSRRPFVISIVGVNGVGKSTNLSKLAFFLLQNDFKLLIAACDTFRSGAVEQLRVHARNLRELSEREGCGTVELYEKGYGKDAANIAKDAVAYATAQQFDVVLIDTAGRRHNDARLMSSLEKFAAFAKPDKILMVGEALVGSDSVAQARSFNAAFGGNRRLDGFIISKCDTVGDMVGSLVSMVHATGIPVVFLGVGQHYGDLRTLNVDWATRLLME